MNVWISLMFEAINVGAAAGFLLLGIWLLRPVTTRLLTPRQRFWLWAVSWISCGVFNGYEIFCIIQVLPVSFRNLITPRCGYDSIPDYLPDAYRGEGVYNLAFPGGGAVRVELNDTIVLILFFVWLAGAIGLGLRMWRGSRKIRLIADQGGLSQHFKCEVNGQPVNVYMCSRLSNSFAYQPLYSSQAAVYLQGDLSERRKGLVLKHELKHIQYRHCWLKGYCVIALVVHWWNPVMWLGYFATCRDLELDCDEQTMRELTPEERREYAHTLLELGAGRQLWDAPLCFGECDAAVRVKTIAAWKPRKRWRTVLTWLLTLFLLICFASGPSFDQVELPADQQLAEEYWQRLTQEDAGELARELTDYLKKQDGMSLYDDVTEIWVAQDGGKAGYCRISTGTWCKVNFWPGINRIGFSGTISVEAPELTGFDRVY